MATNIIHQPNPKQSDRIKDSVGIYDENNIFEASLKKPEFDTVIKELAPRYYITDVLDKIGATGTFSNDEIFWGEEGYFKKNQTVDNVTVTTNTADVTIEETERYFVTQDTISLVSGKQVVVTNIVSTSPQVITVKTLDNSDLVEADFIDGSNKTLYHIGSQMEKCGTAPAGRYFAPTKQSAKQTIFTTTADYCVDDTNQMIFIGNTGYWYARNQILKRKEHRVVKQGNILWGNGSDNSGQGLVPIIFERGTVISDSTSVTEDEVMNFINTLALNGADYNYSEYLCMAGNKYMLAVTKALKAYVVNSNADSRYFNGKAGDFGIVLKTYNINGTIITFMRSSALDEPGAANVSGIPDTQNMGLYLNVGENDRGRGIELLHKKIEVTGAIENESTYRINGIGSVSSGVIQQPKRCWSEYITSAFILKVSYGNSHGIHYLA